MQAGFHRGANTVQTDKRPRGDANLYTFARFRHDFRVLEECADAQDEAITAMSLGGGDDIGHHFTHCAFNYKIDLRGELV